MERQKKALQLASVASMIGKFNMPNIRLLQEQGYHVDVVANFRNPGGLTRELAESLKKELAEMDVNVHDIEIPRSLNPLKILKAYKVVKKLTETEHYDLIHCHSPIGSVICRLPMAVLLRYSQSFSTERDVPEKEIAPTPPGLYTKRLSVTFPAVIVTTPAATYTSASGISHTSPAFCVMPGTVGDVAGVPVLTVISIVDGFP